MKQIKILYMHNITEISGGERSLLNLWENLDNNQFKPYLIIPGEGEFSKEAEKIGVDVQFLEVPKLSFINLFKILKVLFILIWYIRKNKINIIHSYTPRNNILSAVIGKIFRIPIIWHERNLIYEDRMDTTRRFLFLPDRVICNSYAVAERFRKRGRISSKVKVILNGVNLDQFNPLTNAERIKKGLRVGDRKIVGIITNLNRRKRVEYFLKAASMILKRFDNVLFLVVGGEFSDSERGRLEELKEQAHRLGLNEHIIFTGFRRDVPEVLASFDISCHVTVKEACSRAIIESMAAGKPVVAMNDGGNPELVENGVTGILIEPEDINGFVKAVENLLADDVKRIEMGKKARMRAEELFDVKRNVQETEAVYLELVGSLR